MIFPDKIELVRKWFYKYIDTFNFNDLKSQMNIDVKVEHTRRVCLEIVDIGESLYLDQEDLYLAELVALLHDVGRFEQYRKYGTFADPKSENHALLGIRIIKENDVLKHMDISIVALIYRIISYHNQRFLPDEETERVLFFSRLLRDADKLDIYRVVTEYYLQKTRGEHNEAIELDLPDIPHFSEKIYNDLISGRISDYASMRSLNDFKMMQMAWIYDLNFQRSFEIVHERQYLEKIRSVLPDVDKVENLYSKVNEYLSNKILS